MFDMGEEGVAHHIVQFLIPSPPPFGLNILLVCGACEGGENMGEVRKKKPGLESLVILMSATGKRGLLRYSLLNFVDWG